MNGDVIQQKNGSWKWGTDTQWTSTGLFKKKKSRTVKCHWEMKGLERIKWDDLISERQKHDMFSLIYWASLLMFTTCKKRVNSQFPPHDQLEFSPLFLRLFKKKIHGVKKLAQYNTLIGLLPSIFFQLKLILNQKGM